MYELIVVSYCFVVSGWSNTGLMLIRCFGRAKIFLAQRARSGVLVYNNLHTNLYVQPYRSNLTYLIYPTFIQPLNTTLYTYMGWGLHRRENPSEIRILSRSSWTLLSYMYIYIYIYVCTYIYIYIHTHLFNHSYIYIMVWKPLKLRGTSQGFSHQ